MSQYLVVAEFFVEQGSFDECIAASVNIAEASVRAEPGCQRYDVLRLEGDAPRGMLYEVFDDQAAHEAHKQTPHFAGYWEAIADLKVRWKLAYGSLHAHRAFNTPRPS